jgi:hypothetical protein
MRKLLSVLSKELLAFALIELCVRAAAFLGLVAVPPVSVSAFDRLQHGGNVPVAKRLYEADRNLIFRMRANADLVYPRTALYRNRPTTYTVHTNEHGFRSPSFSETKRAGIFRIVCLGDSSTFGMNVEDAEAYPQVLARLLEDRAPARFEVVNLGVPGYSSRQGLELLRREVVLYQPDMVTFAFGTNDRFWRRAISDDMLIRLNQSVVGGVLLVLRNGAQHLYSYRLLERAAAWSAHRLFGNPAADPGAPRVSIEEMRDNIVAAHALLQTRGSSMLVLNNDFYGTDAREGISLAVQQTGIRLLDMHRLFADQMRQRTRDIEVAYHLSSPVAQSGRALFRVRTAGPTSQVVLQVRSQFAPQWQRFPMRDDGQDGDQTAADGIWSRLVPFPNGATVEYVYWETSGTDLVREYGETTADAAARLRQIAGTSPGDIDTFGEFYLHSDSAHPDEVGQRVIAETLLPDVLAAAGVEAGAAPARLGVAPAGGGAGT